MCLCLPVRTQGLRRATSLGSTCAMLFSRLRRERSRSRGPARRQAPSFLVPVVALGAFQSAAELLRLQTKALSAESTSSACIAAAPARWASTCESSSMRACAWISGRQPNRSASGRRAYASTYARLVYGHARVETEPAAGTPRIEGVVHTLSRTVWKHSLPADVGALDDDPACSVALLCVREPTAWLLATAAVVP